MRRERVPAAWWLGLVVAPALLLATGCTRPAPAASPAGTAAVVFVDFSDSVTLEDRTAFRREIEADVLPSLASGDRLLIAPIHDRTLTDFRPLVDATLPAKPEFNGWLDNVMRHKQQARDVDAETVRRREKLKAEIAQVFGRRFASPHTDVMSSLLVAEKVFHGESRRKVLVLMSDMIEDSERYRFERVAWNPGTVDRMVAELEAKRLIPRLPGVCVYVSGASAKSAALAEHIGRFWQAYFKRAGADLDSSRYARVLLHWPPAPACGRTAVAS